VNAIQSGCVGTHTRNTLALVTSQLRRVVPSIGIRSSLAPGDESERNRELVPPHP
jgi:hypothetical protein